MIHVMTNDYFIYLDLDNHIRLSIKKQDNGWNFKAVQNINIDHYNPMDVEIDSAPSIIVSGSIYGGININNVTIHHLQDLVTFDQAKNAIFSTNPKSKGETFTSKNDKSALDVAKAYITNLSKRTKVLLKDWLASDEYQNPTHYPKLLPKIKSTKQALDKLSSNNNSQNQSRYDDEFDRLDYLTCGFNI